MHVPSFFEELLDLEQKGLEKVRERIFISDRCHVVSDLHMRVDGLEEQELSGNNLGTTKRGIGPCYSTKASRSGIRISDIFSKELFDRKIRELARGYKLRYGTLLDDYDVESEISKFDVVSCALMRVCHADKLLDIPYRTPSICCGCRPFHDICSAKRCGNGVRGCERIATR